MNFAIRLTDGTVVVVPPAPDPERFLAPDRQIFAVTDTAGVQWRINRDHIVSITEQPDSP